MTLKKLFAYALGPIGSALLGFISLPVITWFYSVEDIGRISMLQVAVSFSVLLFCLGLDQAYVRDYHENDNKPSLLKNSLLPALGFALITLFGFAIVDIGLISKWLYSIDSLYLSVVTGLCLILALSSRFLSLDLRMQEMALAYSMSQLLPKILFLLFVGVTVWFGYAKDTYNLVAAHTLSIGAVFAVLAWYTRSTWIAALQQKMRWVDLRKLLVFGFPLIFGGLASWALIAMDKIFLRNMSTFSELGVYSVAASVAGVAVVFSGIFNTIWPPLVYKWVAENTVDIKIIDEISEYVLAAIYFIIVLAGLFSWLLPYFLPDNYAAIQFLFMACLIGPLFYTLSETTAVGIAISRKTMYSMFASVGAMCINALGNYILVPLFGAAGAAASTASSFWIFYVFRTELAVVVWRDIPRAKSYSLSFLVCFFAIVTSLYHQALGAITHYVWFVLFILGFIFFKSKTLTLMMVVMNYARKVKPT